MGHTQRKAISAFSGCRYNGPLIEQCPSQQMVHGNRRDNDGVEILVAFEIAIHHLPRLPIMGEDPTIAGSPPRTFIPSRCQIERGKMDSARNNSRMSGATSASVEHRDLVARLPESVAESRDPSSQWPLRSRNASSTINHRMDVKNAETGLRRRSKTQEPQLFQLSCLDGSDPKHANARSRPRSTASAIPPLPPFQLTVPPVKSHRHWSCIQ